MATTHISGSDKGNLVLYTLSTCIWCKKTKAFLNEIGVQYDYVDMDILEGEEREKMLEDLKHWNPKCSFPSLVINNEACVIGYDVEKIKEGIGI
ncbi:MAG: glutaredoxin family protein [Proteobacteria bacterium]|nr:glutaredoxin family protein [Pseudomonadota bacterium]